MKINKFIFILLCMCFAAWHVQGADLHVGSGQTYSTVQEAVDAASSGDVIIIHAGTYREEVNIDVENLTIRPNGTDEVIINGCEPLLNWESVGSGVYKAVMDWDVTESIQMNQIFIDGVMMHEARWPKQPINDNFVLNPTQGEIDRLVKHSDSNKDLIDNDISNEPDARWEGANIYVNLSNPITMKDGQGWTGVVHSKTDSVINIRTKGDTAGIPNPTQGNWEVTTGSYYYLFNPTPSAVAASGGVTALLGDGEWWKKGDTLFVKTPDGNAPASSTSGANLVEAKKYPFAFRPKGSLGVLKNVTIKGLTLFATSITTDNDYNYYQNDLTKDPTGNGSKGLSDAKNVVLDNLNIKYVYHTKDAYGDWQHMYNGRTGIVLTGTNCEIKNCSIQYSAASAISVSGQRNKVTNNMIYDVNYMIGECGAVNQGAKNWYTYDHNIGYNTIYNTPHAAISLREVENSDTSTPGVARVHHNYVYNMLTRVWDAGVIDEAGELGNWVRIDHNIIQGDTTHNGENNDVQIGIYLDYGYKDAGYASRYILDHNVIHLIKVPIQINHANQTRVYNNTCYIHCGWGDITGSNDIDLNQGTIVKNNFARITMSSTAQRSHNVACWDDDQVYLTGGTGEFSNYFTDYENADYTLLSGATKLINAGTTTPWDDETDGTPDVGAFEYGVTPWTAGYNTTPPTTYHLTIDNDTNKGSITQADPNAAYLDGDNAALKVSAIPGYEFSGWTGDVPAGHENDNPLKLLMTADKSITANYTSVPTDTLTLTSNGSGSVEVTPAPYNDDEFIYNEGTELTLVPKPAPLYEFDSWSGDVPAGSENDYPLTITLNSKTSITAMYTPIPPGGAIYAVAAAVEGNDRYTATDGTIFYSDEDYVNGGRTWSPDEIPSISGTDNDTLFQFERVYSVLAYDFPIPPGQYQIEMGFSELYFTSNNQRVFDVKAEGQVIVDNLDIHSVVGADAAHVTISDTINVSDGNLDIDFDGIKDKPKVSYIKILQTSDSVGNVFTLTTSVNIGGSGTVSPSNGVFYEGQSTTITATANAGFKFSNWTGDTSSTVNPISILMDTNKTLTANFVEDEMFTLNTSSINGYVRLDPDQSSYYNGTVVNIVAVADSGYIFDSWSGDTGLVQDQNRQNIVIDHDMTITANFVKETGISGLSAKNNGVTIYPNPNDGKEVNIEIEHVDGEVNVCIYDITGAKCYENTWHSKTFTIPLSEMDKIKSGYYLIRISTDKDVFIEKLIVN